jgi:DNA-directed RNA polymerase subunit M/transcription elongation factor TFIIS
MLNFRGTEYTIIKFKECPRCQGDLYITEDGFGRYLSCLQCGYLRDLAQPLLDSQLDSQMKSRLDSAPAAATLQEAELEVA